jgi:hypothetical protein
MPRLVGSFLSAIVVSIAAACSDGDDIPADAPLPIDVAPAPDTDGRR